MPILTETLLKADEMSLELKAASFPQVVVIWPFLCLRDELCICIFTGN